MSIYTVLGEQSVLCEKKIQEIIKQQGIESFDVISVI